MSIKKKQIVNNKCPICKNYLDKNDFCFRCNFRIGFIDKKFELMGLGCAIQFFSIFLLFIPFIGIGLFIALFIIGSILSKKYLCSNCGNKVYKESRICPVCKINFSDEIFNKFNKKYTNVGNITLLFLSIILIIYTFIRYDINVTINLTIGIILIYIFILLYRLYKLKNKNSNINSEVIK